MWVINSEDGSLPRIIIKDSCKNGMDLSFDDFLRNIHSGVHGQKVEGTSDSWDKLIKSILDYNTKMKLWGRRSKTTNFKTTSSTLTLFSSYLTLKSHLEKLPGPQLNFQEKLNSFLKKVSYPLRTVKPKPLWIVEVEIIEFEPQ